MSKHSGRTNYLPRREDREAFIRENAVAIVYELEARIERYRREIKLGLSGKRQLRKELHKLQALNAELAERVARQSELLSKRAEKTP